MLSISPAQTFVLLLLCCSLLACGGGGGGGGVAAPTAGGDTTPNNRDNYDAFAGGFPALQQAPANNTSMLDCRASVFAPAIGSTITGTILFEREPATVVGIDYFSTQQLPARGVVVEAVSGQGGQCGDTVVATALTDANGDYGLVVPVNQPVCVQVRAQMYHQGAQSWQLAVTDNTRSNAPYYLIDSALTTPSADPVRNLLARSGWNQGAGAYTSARAAAPFAILDSACEALSAVTNELGGTSFPPLYFRWSKNNVAANGPLDLGEVGGAFYSRVLLLDSNRNVLDVANEIFLLGDDGSDTDEYDNHVITHEFAHYATTNLARSDSVGGSHRLGDRLDLSVAFDEGWADAFSGLVLADPVYKDTLGAAQSSTFGFDLRSRDPLVTAVGWYSETSVYNFTYNLVDDEGFSFGQLFNALIGIKDTAFSTGLFAYIRELKQQNPGALITIDNLAALEGVESVPVSDSPFEDSNETVAGNDVAGQSDVLPVYDNLLLNTPQTVCSNPQNGRFNKLGVIQRVVFDAPAAASYRFEASPVGTGNVLLLLTRDGQVIVDREASNNSAVVINTHLQAARYLLLVTDVNNFSENNGGAARRCFSVRVD